MDQLDNYIQQLHDVDNTAAQAEAAEALARLGEQAQPAIVALVQHCGSVEEDVCNWCIAALESVGTPTAEQIEDLALLVNSGNVNVAFWAATLLGRAGKLAEPASSVLAERASDDSTPEVQKRAAWALKQFQEA